MRLKMADLRKTKEEKDADHPLLGHKTEDVDVRAWLPFFGYPDARTDFSFAATGFHPWQLTKLYDLYGGEKACPRRCLLISLVYLRHMPLLKKEAYKQHLPGVSLERETLSAEYNKGVMHLLSSMDEIGTDVEGRQWFTKPWAHRSVNHFPFEPLASLAVDVFPVYVCANKADYSGYYSRHAKKVQLCVTALGFIAGLSALNPGPRPDGDIWGSARQAPKADSYKRVPLRPNDIVLGDGAYADAACVVIPNRRVAKSNDENRASDFDFFTRLRTPACVEFNRAHAAARSRVERAIARLKQSFKVFREIWNLQNVTGGLEWLNSCFQVCAHLHNFRLRWSIPEMPLCGYTLKASTLTRQQTTAKYPWSEADALASQAAADALLELWAKKKKKATWQTLVAREAWGALTDAELSVEPGTWKSSASREVWSPSADKDRLFMDGAEEDDVDAGSLRSSECGDLESGDSSDTEDSSDFSPSSSSSPHTSSTTTTTTTTSSSASSSASSSSSDDERPRKKKRTSEAPPPAKEKKTSAQPQKQAPPTKEKKTPAQPQKQAPPTKEKKTPAQPQKKRPSESSPASGTAPPNKKPRGGSATPKQKAAPKKGGAKKPGGKAAKKGR